MKGGRTVFHCQSLVCGLRERQLHSRFPEKLTTGVVVNEIPVPNIPYPGFGAAALDRPTPLSFRLIACSSVSVGISGSVY